MPPLESGDYTKFLSSVHKTCSKIYFANMDEVTYANDLAENKSTRWMLFSGFYLQ